MNRRNLWLIGAALVLLPGCNRTEQENAPAAAEVDTAADEQAIRANVARWLELVRSKDAAGIAQLYAEDGAAMAPNAPIAKGRAAIQQLWQSMLAGPGELTFEPEQILVSSSGDMALDRGTYRFGEDVGKYVVVWRKVDGEWKAAADIFNSDLPASGG